MKLTAYPFHPVTGELLPAYRDAYLRGDLSSEHTAAVDEYVQANRHRADDTLRRFHQLKHAGHRVQPVGWVRRQFDLIRTEPERFRRRAASLVVGAALLGGAVLAGTNLPTPTSLPTDNEPTFAQAGGDETAESNASSTVMVRGRILDENGRPLVGATVLQKGSYRGVSTDADGNYALRLPADEAATLQYAYAGYTDNELRVDSDAVKNVTLFPHEQKKKAAKKHRWLIF